MCSFLLLVLLAAAWIPESPARRLSDKEIREKFEILTNEVVELKHDVQELRSQIGPAVDNKDSMKIMMASREVLPGDVFRFSVQYTGEPNVHLLNHWSTHFNHHPEMLSSETNKLEPNGNVFESSTNVEMRNGSMAIFAISNGQKWIVVYLRNSPGGNLTETEINLPVLDVVPEGDFVYDPGHNMSIKVTAPFKDRGKSRGGFLMDSFHAQYYFTRPGDRQVFPSFTSDDNTDSSFFRPLETMKFLDNEERSFNLNTAAYPISGVIDMTSGLNFDEGLVKRTEIGKQVVLRPKTQTDPFPEDRPYTVKNNWKKENEKGEYISGCSIGDRCYFYCIILGNDVSDLQVFKTVNGVRKEMAYETRVDHLYQNVAMAEVHPEPDGSSPVSYTCVGSNPSGVSVKETTIYQFGIGANILKNESSMEKFDNGTALVTCTGQGRPRPEVTISCVTQHSSDVIIYQTDDVTRVTKLCEDSNMSWDFVSCNAENVLKTDFYLFNHHGNYSIYNH